MVLWRRKKEKVEVVQAISRDSVFVSYRRDDDPAEARSIADRLRRVYGSEKVFFDVDTITAGDDFENKIADKLSNTRFMVVVIGPKWESLFASHSTGERDYVVEEIEAGLSAEEVTILPVTVNKASMPSPEALPASIRRFASLQAIEVRHARFENDVDQDLIPPISEVLAPQPRRFETKEVKVRIRFPGGYPTKQIRLEIKKQAEQGWQHTGDAFTNGTMGFGTGVILFFSREADPN